MTREQALDAVLRRMPGILMNAQVVGAYFPDWECFAGWLELHHARKIRAEFRRILAEAVD